MADNVLNPISMDSSFSVPAVYAPQAIVPTNGFNSGGFSGNGDSMAGFSNTTAEGGSASYAAEASATFAQPMAFGDNDGQMSGFVSYLNKGPKMHTETGSLDNVASLFK